MKQEKAVRQNTNDGEEQPYRVGVDHPTSELGDEIGVWAVGYNPVEGERCGADGEG